MAKLIAVVDDEPDILNLVAHHLKRSGFEVKKFRNSEGLFKFLKLGKPELIILDLMLPDSDGLDSCKVLKNDPDHSSIPIIMLTAKAEELDKILGLELGADDYITKPFSPKELVARVRAVLRRNDKKENTDKIVIADDILMDEAGREVYVSGEKAELTSAEFNILKILSSRPGVVFSREKLLDGLWGSEKAVIDRTIDVHIRHLRSKLGKAGRIIKNVRGIGYKIEK